MNNQSGYTQILIAVLILVLLFSGFLFLRKNNSNQTEISQNSISQPEMKIYKNIKYGYSISYPSSLAVREFPDTGTGAGFRPVDKPEDPQYEVITINALGKSPNLVNDSLESYAKVAAGLEIQNYQKLNSIDPVTTNSGLTGYKTNWMVLPMPILGATSSGVPTMSLPITYFDLPNEATPSTVQVSLSDKKYESDYESMIKTFSVTP